MTAYDFEGNDWDEITEGEKRGIVDRLVRERDALSDDYETLVQEHDKCPEPASPEAPGSGLDAEGPPAPPSLDVARLRNNLLRLHAWDVSKGWYVFNAIVAEFDDIIDAKP